MFHILMALVYNQTINFKKNILILYFICSKSTLCSPFRWCYFIEIRLFCCDVLAFALVNTQDNSIKVKVFFCSSSPSSFFSYHQHFRCQQKRNTTHHYGKCNEEKDESNWTKALENIYFLLILLRIVGIGRFLCYTYIVCILKDSMVSSSFFIHIQSFYVCSTF